LAKVPILNHNHSLNSNTMKAHPNEDGGYDTMTEALAALQKKGYTFNFNLISDGLEHKTEEEVIKLSPSEFYITEVHRFEGASNPSDNSILYAIESEGGLKGTLVNAYGLYADPLSSEMIKKLDTRQAKQ